MLYSRKIFVWILLNMLVQQIHAQGNITPIYYSTVEMPASLKTNYYGQFDPKILAADLSLLLTKSTGRSFTPMPYSGEKKGILLLLDNDFKNESNEAGEIESNGKDLVRIRGRYTTGISYAMYSWLEQLGFRFYLPGEEWTIIPSLRSIFSDPIARKIYKPAFKLRMFNPSGGIFPVKGLDEDSQNEKDWQLWHRRNRMGSDFISIDGHIGEYFNIVHKKEIEKDPGILAPTNGKRQYHVEGKLDPTNKKGVTLFSDWIVSEFKNYQKTMPSFLPYKKYYSADAGDGLNYCHTPECDRQFKTVSDQVFSIVNETARKIKLADPRAGVSTLAYTERADTPGIRLEPNVHVMVVPTGFQSVSTPTELMQRWAKKTTNLSQYDFLNIGVWSYDMPFYNLYQYHRNLKFLQSLKIQGMNFETSLSKFASGIQQYFILKFLCDPYTSIDNVLNEFCRLNFEQAADPMKKLLKEWYFSNTHLSTGYDKISFGEDELGRFINYLSTAENTAGISTATKKRIEELKAYTVYLCMFYELFNDLKNNEAFTASPSLRAAHAEEMLVFSWQMYRTKIFHNTQLNDMLKQYVAADKKDDWDFRNSDRYKNITLNAAEIIKSSFEKMKKKYLSQAVPFYTITDEFLADNIKNSADSFRISSIDERAFGNYFYAFHFYSAGPGTLKINYQTDTSQTENNKRDKIAIIGVESIDYRFIKNNFIYKENSKGSFSYSIPAKGHYKLYLSQYNATHVSYTIIPGKNLFYHNKRSIMMNGMLMQDHSSNISSNKYLAFLAPPTDSLYFTNLYWNASNTIKLFTAGRNSIPVNSSRQPYLNSAAIPKSSQGKFIFYDNTVFRWPPILKNAAPYYFFLKYPLK